MTTQSTNASLNPIERVLRIFTEVRSGEGVTALLMALNIFLILICYYILKPAREAFMSLEGQFGAQLASYASAAMAVLLAPIVVLYGKLAQRVARTKLIGVVNGLFILFMVIFHLWARAGLPFLGLAFFVWVGIFNIMVIAQFWAYANDIYLPEQGKRLFPMILLGQNFGAILGTRVADRTLDLTGSSSFMPLVAAVFLGLSIVLTLWVDSRQKTAPKVEARQSEAEKPLGKEGGFDLIWKSRYLTYIALLILVLNLINTTGEFILRNSVYSAAGESSVATDVFAGSFYSDFFFWVNTLTLLIQSLLVSRILKFLGVRGALFVLPCISLLGYGTIALLPILTVVTVAKTAENSVDYSLMNTLRAALYLPTSREEKYKAKQAIDTFFVRTGDVLSAGFVYLGTQILGFAARGFAGVLFIIVLFWLALAGGIAREHRKLLPEE